TLGPDHPHSLLTRANLGVNYCDAGRLEEGARLLEEALERARGRPGVWDALGLVRTRLDAAYDASGRFPRAEPLLPDTLDRARSQYGPGAPRTAGAMAQLGRNLIRQRKWIEAESVLRECLAIREKIQADDRDIFDTRSLLGASLLGQGRFAEAEPLLL